MVEHFQKFDTSLGRSPFEIDLHQANPVIQFLLISYPWTMNEHKTDKRRPRGLLYVLCTFNLRQVSKG